MKLDNKLMMIWFQNGHGELTHEEENSNSKSKTRNECGMLRLVYITDMDIIRFGQSMWKIQTKCELDPFFLAYAVYRDEQFLMEVGM